MNAMFTWQVLLCDFHYFHAGWKEMLELHSEKFGFNMADIRWN